MRNWFREVQQAGCRAAEESDPASFVDQQNRQAEVLQDCEHVVLDQFRRFKLGGEFLLRPPVVSMLVMLVQHLFSRCLEYCLLLVILGDTLLQQQEVVMPMAKGCGFQMPRMAGRILFRPESRPGCGSLFPTPGLCGIRQKVMEHGGFRPDRHVACPGKLRIQAQEPGWGLSDGAKAILCLLLEDGDLK
jgi:hypothetical protein